MDYTDGIKKYLEREIAVISALDTQELNRAVSAIADVKKRGGTIWTMGNGGSASTASHMVCDLGKGVYELAGGDKFNIRCLCDNVPMMLAVSNDIGYENVFLYQLEGVVRPDDLVIAISGSGNSENVVRAAEYARGIGARLLAMTGYSGGRLREIADFNMHVPCDDMQVSEDLHLIFDHMILQVLSSAEISEGSALKV